MKAKIPNTAERCAKCSKSSKSEEQGVHCEIYEKDMRLNKNGQPWENWVCKRFFPRGPRQ